MSSSSNSDQILDLVHSLEESKIKSTSFDFISDKALSNQSGFSLEEIHAALSELYTRESRDVILIDNQITPTNGYDASIKYLVRSRIGHIIWCLYNSRAYKRGGSQRNVADIKYIKYLKEIPKRDKPLSALIENEKLVELLEFKKQSNTHNNIIQDVLQDLSRQYSKISDFQLESTLKILEGLKNRTNKSEGLSIVAGTELGNHLLFNYH